MPSDTTTPSPECNCLALRQAARHVTQFYDQCLAPAGLRTTQLSILAKLKRLGPLTINALARELVMDRTTLTRDLGLLSKQGWARIEVGEDHRLRVVTLTEGGQRVLAQALPLWQQAQSQMLDRLGPQHVEALLAELSTTTTPSH